MNQTHSLPDIDDGLLREVMRRHKSWHIYWALGFTSNITVGILGVVSSSLAAISHDPYSRYAAAISAVCFAIIGFARPDRFYFKYIVPWRMLDHAILRYRFQDGSKEELIASLEFAESTLSGIEAQKESPDHQAAQQGVAPYVAQGAPSGER